MPPAALLLARGISLRIPLDPSCQVDFPPDPSGSLVPGGLPSGSLRILLDPSCQVDFPPDPSGSLRIPGARWTSLWIFDAFWHILYLAILLSISYLWSPNKNNLQYAYMDELGQDEDDEDDETESAKTFS